MKATEKQIKDIESGLCPICGKNTIDFIAAGLLGGADECMSCNAMWQYSIKRKDGKPIRSSHFEKELMEAYDKDDVSEKIIVPGNIDISDLGFDVVSAKTIVKDSAVEKFYQDYSQDYNVFTKEERKI